MRKAIVIVVLIAIGIAGIVLGIRAQSTNDVASNALTVPVQRTDVTVTTAANGAIVDEFTYALAPGADAVLTASAGNALSSGTTATAATGVTYKTKKVFVEVGDDVKRGEKLLRVKDSLDETSKLKSPFPGRVRELNTEERAAAASNAVVIGSGRVLASVLVSEYDIEKITPKQEVELTLDATKTSLTGRVISIGVTADDSSGVKQYQVLIAPKDLPKDARLGMSVSATIVTESAPGVLAVPTSAITMNGTQATVKVLNAENVEQSVNVTVGVVGDAMTEITGGLTEGQRVVVGVDNAIPDLSNRPFRNQPSQPPAQNSPSNSNK